ncbi:unnamed protein product [Sphacelaria rigidula]
MTSGFGMSGNGRCYSKWSTFEKCMADSDDSTKECMELRQDYFDCVHLNPLVMFFEPKYALEHRKEINPNALIHRMIGFTRGRDRDRVHKKGTAANAPVETS